MHVGGACQVERVVIILKRLLTKEEKVKITEIKRTVSGADYSNVELTAKLDEGDKVIDCIKSLDNKAREALEKIELDRQAVAIKNNEADGLPF